MKQSRVSDRRTGRNRRVAQERTYAGMERRLLKYRRLGVDRRGLLPPTCITCGKAFGMDGLWRLGSSEADVATDNFALVCAECATKD